MAKPDLQGVRVTPAGQVYRDDGESSLELALNKLPVLTNDNQVAASGIPVGGLYLLSSSHADADSTLKRRNS